MKCSLSCACRDPRHVVILEHDPEDGDIIWFQLSQFRPWWRRVYDATLYILNKQPLMWDNVILDETSKRALKEWVNLG